MVPRVAIRRDGIMASTDRTLPPCGFSSVVDVEANSACSVDVFVVELFSSDFPRGRKLYLARD